MAGDLVCLGAVAGAHGVRGNVRLRSFTEDPADIAAYGPVTDETGKRRFEVTVIGESRGQVVARIAGIDDREAAEALKGLRLYVERAVLPAPDADEFYHADLIGLAAVDADGKTLGRVQAVFDYGAGDFIEIRRPGSPGLLVPFTRAAVPEIDIAAGRIVVVPPAEIEAEEDAKASEVDDDGSD